MAKYYVTVTKLSANQNAFDVPALKGWTEYLPQVGQHFFMYCVDDANIAFRTSTIQAMEQIQEDDRAVAIIIQTRNSSYRIQIDLVEAQ